MRSFVILCLLGATTCLPLQETTTTELYTTELSESEQHIINLQRNVNLVSYIQNFKMVMSEYVRSQYGNLTINEMEKVKEVLENFLKCFADDLRDTVQGNAKEDPEEIIEDGLRNETFHDIKVKIVQEFPEVTEETADKIVKKLRKNLYMTRYKLDEIIRESQRAQIANA